MRFSFKELYDYGVLDKNGKKIAQLKNILVDVETEKSYFMIGQLMSQKLIPITLLGSFSHQEKTLRIKISEKELRGQYSKAPFSYDLLITGQTSRKIPLHGIHETVSVLDSNKEAIGLLYDYYVDSEIGKRLGIVFIPLKDAGAALTAGVLPARPYTTCTLPMGEVDIKRGANPKLILKVPKEKIPWSSGIDATYLARRKLLTKG